MRSRWSAVILAFTSVLALTGCQDPALHEQASSTRAHQGPYLGMTPPGEVPELFAPGVVSDVYWEHSGAVFSPDGKELFWSVAINEGREPRIIVILHMQRIDEIWSQPELAPFNVATYNHVNSISPDGQRLYFFSSSDEEPSRAWVVKKTEKEWGEPERLRVNTVDNPDSVVNEVHEARNGNLYLSGPLETMPGGRGIVRSRLVDGVYQEYESLGRHVNSPHSGLFPNHSPTVDPDERFVIFASNRPGGFGVYDLYISYRQSDGTWGPATNLGPEINSVGTSRSWPQISPDGRFLFFVSSSRPLGGFVAEDYTYAELKRVQESVMNGWGNIFWVSTSFVDTLKPADTCASPPSLRHPVR